jgi:RecA-family ATPase
MLSTVDLVADSPLPQVSDHIIYPWLLPGRLTLMCGPTEIGKTTLTLEIIAAVLRGGHLWDRYPCRKIDKVLYLHAEHALATVQDAAKMRGDIPQGKVVIAHDFGPDGASLLRNGQTNVPLLNELRNTIVHHKPQLIIAEPISAFLGGDENDNREARLVVSLLTDLAANAGAALLTHHHFGKSHFDTERQRPKGIPSGEARGAMSFEDAAERVLYLRRVGDKDRNHIKIETPKSKGFPVSDVTLAFDEDTLTYSHVGNAKQERDLISMYNRRRHYPDEPARSFVAHFRSLWECSQAKTYLMLKRCRRVGLIAIADLASVTPEPFE